MEFSHKSSERILVMVTTNENNNTESMTLRQTTLKLDVQNFFCYRGTLSHTSNITLKSLNGKNKPLRNTFKTFAVIS